MFPFRIAVTTLPALMVGAALTFIAIAMAMKQWWAYQQLVANPKVDEAAYAHSENQIQRRLVVSGLLLLLGLLIPLGDQLEVFFARNPALFFAYWIGVLLIVFMMVVMAVIDLLSTLAYTQKTRVRLGMERRAIEEEIRKYRASQNGRHDPSNDEDDSDETEDA